uniref:DUF3782 domain-containing protein n=1 Tax=Candidatus Kentrum sp. UNK TaxID=2126344 RepID=A0A451ALS4_9GAMM|nr:MAG: hypothetical protein BECKUNK1418G_GA0071005_11203 [Candidatus Kentron sp. UNK]VFK72470.1 MAG: hypothetical protein BECKUNK1418H_GA0071006_11173 [Candidatus Kentron sp. UNK]
MKTTQIDNTPSTLFVESDRCLAELGAYLRETARLMQQRSEEAERRSKEETQRIREKIEQRAKKEAERREAEAAQRKQEAEQREKQEAQRRKEEAQRREAEATQRRKEIEQKAKQEDERREKEAAQEAIEAARKEREAEKEARRREREVDKKLNKLEDLFTTQWGRLVESLVEGALVPLFQDYGIPIQRTIRRVDGVYQKQEYEFDILVVNGIQLIIVEVKTTLRPDDVTNFIKKLDQCKLWMPEYASKIIYGAVAFLQANASAHRMAEKQRLFVIRTTGDSAAIVNQEEFEARAW